MFHIVNFKMKAITLSLTWLIVFMVTSSYGDYDCVCNYSVEKAVYAKPDVNSQPLGYLYEFDCKPDINEKDSSIGIDYLGIQYERKIGYITRSHDVQIQICPGVPPGADLIPTTLKTTRTMTTTLPSTVSTTTTTPSTQRTTATTTQATTKPSTFPTSSSTKPTTYTPLVSTTITPSTTFLQTTSTSTSSSTSPTTMSTTIPTTKASTTTTHPSTTLRTSTTPTTVTTTRTATTTTTKPTTPAPVTWPIGTYGLMQTAQGCPGSIRWVTGWRKQDTEDDDAHNYFSAGIKNYLAGDFKSNNLVTKFCIKDTASTSVYDKPWPKGTYCILKHRACPSGFRSGFIHWDDEDSDNGNSRGGALPDGQYDSNTQIYYCCRGDGQQNSEIDLPTQKPFILLRFGNACQSVRGMTVREVFVRYDDEDGFNSSGRGGWHPFDDGGSKDHILHFCYYHPRAGTAIVG